jgi:hypothetical protein
MIFALNAPQRKPGSKMPSISQPFPPTMSIVTIFNDKIYISFAGYFLRSCPSLASAIISFDINQDENRSMKGGPIHFRVRYEVYQEKGYLPDGPNSRIGLSLAEQGGSLISLLGLSGECSKYFEERR